jgi:hypothetical protein
LLLLCARRFVLDIIRVFQGSFGGQTIYQNPHYVSPNKVRHEINAAKGGKYKARVEAESERGKRQKTLELEPDEVANVFKLDGGKRRAADTADDDDEGDGDDDVDGGDDDDDDDDDGEGDDGDDDDGSDDE